MEVYQAYRPSLRSITSLPSASAGATSRMAAAALSPLPKMPQSRAPDEQMDRRSLSAAMLPELPTDCLEPQAEHVEGSSGASTATVGVESSMSGQPGTQDNSPKPEGPPTASYRRLPRSKAERAEERDLADTVGLSSGVDESAHEYGASTSAAARVQADGAQDLGSWLWRPWMWAGFKRGIKRRAAQC